jgi:carbon-monoxide dehydrogenase medium subunit
VAGGEFTVIPPRFDYVRPATVDDAVLALSDMDNVGDVKVLAGGQSLLPVLRLRLGAPALVVDLGRTAGVRGVREDGDSLVIGAMTTHYQVLTAPLVRRHCPLLAEATGTVADPAVRHRGTLGGALAHADPAGDLGAVARACDTTMVIAGPRGRRTVPAAEFFHSYLETAIQPDELLVETRWPKLSPEWGYRYEKANRVAQSWAIVAAAALVRRDGESIAEARIGLTNMGAIPLRATVAEDALAGRSVSDDGVTPATDHAADGTAPPADLDGQPDYRAHLARVLTRRAVLTAAMRTGRV